MKVAVVVVGTPAGGGSRELGGWDTQAVEQTPFFRQFIATRSCEYVLRRNLDWNGSSIVTRREEIERAGRKWNRSTLGVLISCRLRNIKPSSVIYCISSLTVDGCVLYFPFPCHSRLLVASDLSKFYQLADEISWDISTFRFPFGTMLCIADVGVEMIECAVGLIAARKVAGIHTLHLLSLSARSFNVVRIAAHRLSTTHHDGGASHVCVRRRVDGVR